MNRPSLEASEKRPRGHWFRHNLRVVRADGVYAD